MLGFQPNLYKNIYEQSEFNNFPFSTFNFPLNKAWVIVFILKVSVLQSMIFMEFVNCFYNIFHAKILTKFYNIEKCKNPNFIEFWGL